MPVQGNTYTARDLRQPIVLLRGTQVPSEDDTTWRLNLREYHRAFAYVEDSYRVRQGSQDADARENVLFTIRYEPTIVVEAGNVVAWENTLYQVLKTRRVRAMPGSPHEFLEIVTFLHGKTATVAPVANPEIPQTTDPASHGNPFWDWDGDEDTRPGAAP